MKRPIWFLDESPDSKEPHISRATWSLNNGFDLGKLKNELEFGRIVKEEEVVLHKLPTTARKKTLLKNLENSQETSPDKDAARTWNQSGNPYGFYLPAYTNWY